MSESFRQATGRKVISRASAEELGRVSHFVVDAERRHITALVLGRGRKARLVDWEFLSGFGPDAVMVADDGALRGPDGDRERLAVDGKLDLLDKRALTEGGNEVGPVSDVTFDPQTGSIESLLVGEGAVPGSALLGSGSYAVVLDASPSDQS